MPKRIVVTSSIDGMNMRFTLRQVAVFEAIAEAGSVSLAADRVAMTQSAASMALAQLEEALGHPLFDRHGKHLVLNQWGYWLRGRARRLLFDAREIEMGFSGQHLVSGEISVGASQTPGEQLMPGLISDLDNDFPQLRVRLDIDNTEHVIDGLLHYRYDLGIIEGPCDDTRVRQEVWCSDNLVIVAASNHPYARQPLVSMAQLEEAKWVLREPGAGTRDIFDRAIHGKIGNLNVWREYSHVPVLAALVANHYYLSCLPYYSVASLVESGDLAILPVEGLNMNRSFSFIWRDDGDANPGGNPLRECLLKAARRIAK